MLFDVHVHSRVSPDSQADPAEVVAYAGKQGLGLCFTEHVDYVTPEVGLDSLANDRPQSKADFLTDLSAYPAAYEPLRGEQVLLGLEIGLTAAYLPLNRQTAATEGLDYIIGSVHFVDGLDLYKDYFTKTDAADPCRRYLEYALEMTERCEFFDSLGHIDYISRYSPLADKDVRYEDYADAYDALLTALIERGKAIEINTARFGDARAETNLYRIYTRYRELGGRYVTLGSDAHDTARLGFKFDRALVMARETGLTPVYFKRRKPCVCSV